MAISIYQVDAFTAKPFGGNPAGVCILPEPTDKVWMQAVAREMNLSETAFLHPEQDGYQLRWFTPAVEVDLCGHATLASAHILWETGELALDQEAHFHTASGPLKACKDEGLSGWLSGQTGWIWMDFPALPPRAMTPPKGLEEALGIKLTYVGQNRLDLLAVVDTASDVRGLHPDFARLRSVDTRGVIVTAPSDQPEYDFVSRAFFPTLGIDEDPVTGSAHPPAGGPGTVLERASGKNGAGGLPGLGAGRGGQSGSKWRPGPPGWPGGDGDEGRTAPGEGGHHLGRGHLTEDVGRYLRLGA